tara:strand:- start:289 stop:747 length:459 start_codon:yes stop_codon:yes gene_type:complete
MLKQFTNFFGGSATTEHRSGQDAIQLATCVILLEAAHVDDDFTEAERLHIVEVARERFDLSPEEALELLDASAHAREQSADLFRFTREINSSCTVPEKIRFVEEIWRIFYSDGVLDGHEDHLARKLGNLLNLNHRQLIDAKMRVREELPEAE